MLGFLAEFFRSNPAALRSANHALQTEVAERRKVELSLRESEERYRRVFEKGPLGMTLSGRSYHFIEVNNKFCEMLGYTEQELRDLSLPEVTYPDDVNNDADLAEKMFRGEVPSYQIQKRYLKKNGEILWANLTATVIRDETGKVLYRQAMIEDISERKRAEEEIARLNADLGRRAADLEAANKELETFSYSVSHDLRAPLRSIAGFSQALLEDCASQLDENGKALLGKVRAATQRMGNLIDALLRLSQASRVEMVCQSVDLTNLANEALEDLKQRSPDRKVEVDIAPSMTAAGDPRLLRVVINNLFENAWKFTAKKSHAEIQFGSCAQNGGKVFFIRDNGAGFDMAYVKKLFGAFQRLHSPNEYEGTGIGLATVQRIVYRHQGRVWAEAKVNEGATFYFTLGRQESAA